MRRLLGPLLSRAALLAVFPVLVVPAFVVPAFAQESGANKAAAEALFQQGQELMNQAKYEQACEKFRSSQQLDAGLGTLLHLADCYEKLGRTASAWATFEEASSIAASRGETSRYEIARSRATALKPLLSYVVIRSKEPLPSGATVQRDGTALPQALWGVAIPNDPGEVTVSVSAEGYVTQEVKVTIGKATPAPVEITLPALERIAEPEPAPTPLEAPTVDLGAGSAPDNGGPDLQTWGIVAGGVGVVALGVSLVLTIMGNSDHQESLKNCDAEDENACGPGGVELRNDALTKLGVATGFGIGGAVALGGGALLYFAAPSSEAAPTTAIGVGYRGVW